MKSTLLLVAAVTLSILLGLWALYTALARPAQVEVNPPSSLGGPSEYAPYGLAVDQRSSNTVCAGVYNDGPYCTRNGGQTWDAEPLDFATDGAKHIRNVVWSAKTGSFYMATRDGIFRRDLKHQVGVWDSLGPFDLLPIFKFVNTLLVVRETDVNGSEDTIYAGTDAGVIESQDSGNSWQPLPLKGDTPVTVLALARDAAGTIYAGTKADGIFRLDATTRSWGPVSPFTSEVASVFALVSPNANVLYAGTNGNGVFKSVDGGNSWQPWNDGIDADPHARIIQALAIDGQGALYAGTVDFGIYKLSPTESQWQSKSTGLRGYALSIIAIAPAGENTIYIGTFGDGIYKSVGGENWTQVGASLHSGFRVNVLAVDPKRNRLYAGTAGGGVYTWVPGQAWTRQVLGIPVPPDQRNVVALDIVEGITPTVYAGTDKALYSGQIPSDNSTRLNWVSQTITTGVTSLAHRGSTLYAGVTGREGGVYISNDNGAHWTRSTKGITSRDSFRLVDIKLGDGDTVFAYLSGTGIYESDDAGKTWHPLIQTQAFLMGISTAQPILLQWVLGLADRRAVYAQALEGVYAWRDAVPWHQTFLGTIDSIAADSARPDLAYSGVRQTSNSLQPTYGVMVSQDQGSNWRLAQTITSPVTALFIDHSNPSSTALYIGTGSRGVYQTTISVPSILLLPQVAFRLWVFLTFVFFLISFVAVSRELRVRPWALLAALVTIRLPVVRLLDEHNALTPLERLILATWSFGTERPEEVQRRLDGKDAQTSWSQLTAALDDLERRQKLIVRNIKGEYSVRSNVIPTITRTRLAQRSDLLAKAVREENDVCQDVHAFFKQAGYLPRAAGQDLLLISPQSELDIFTGVLTGGPIAAEDVDALRTRALDAYHGTLKNREIYAVVTSPPQASAYKYVTDLYRSLDHTRIVLFSHRAIRQALSWGASAVELGRSQARLAPYANLYRLDGPAIDPLDFFGREKLVHELALAVEQHQVVRLRGLPSIGKSSVLWQLRERFAQRPCAIVDLALVANQPGALLAAVREKLAAEAQAWRFEWNPETASGELSFRQEEEFLHELLLGYGKAMASRLPGARLLILVDSITADSPQLWQTMANGVTREQSCDVVLATSDRRGAEGEDLGLVDMQPLDNSEMTELVQSLLRPLGSVYSEEALTRLRGETGGHPLLVRQIANLVQLAGEGIPLIRPGQVDAAVDAYLQSQPRLPEQLWHWFTSDEQRILAALANPESGTEASVPLPLDVETMTQLEHWGVIVQSGGTYRIAISLLAQWLKLYASIES